MKINKIKVLVGVIIILLVIIVAQYFCFKDRNNKNQYVNYKFISSLVEEERNKFGKNGTVESEFSVNLSKVLEADTCKDLKAYIEFHSGMDLNYLIKKLNTNNKEQRKYISKFIEYLVLEKELLYSEKPNIFSTIMVRPPMTSDTLNYGDELYRGFYVIMKNTNKSFKVSIDGQKDTLISGSDMLYKYRAKCTKRGENILKGTIFYNMNGMEVPNSFEYKFFVK